MTKISSSPQSRPHMSSNTQPNAPALPRGAACLDCREHSVKCDGKRPACGRCVDRNKPEDCEYVGANACTETWFLEERIKLSKARIEVLKNPQHSSSVALRYPYPAVQFPSKAAPSPNTDWPLDIKEKLLDTFIRHSSDLGFFLYIPPFRESMLLPAGHTVRLSDALVYATYLWGIYLSGDEVIRDTERHETMYLSRAVEALNDAPDDKSPSFIHTIQAQVLIASYFFSNNKVHEGNYYVTKVVADTLFAGLHKIRSTNGSLRSMLPSPSNYTEEGERILAMWAVFILDRSWAANLGQKPNMTFSADDPQDALDTPWPLDIESYVQGFLLQNIRTEKTLLKFFNYHTTPDKGKSVLAIQAKATLVWERAVDLCTHGSPGVNVYNEINSLISLAGALKTGLPSVIGVSDDTKIRRLVICHGILDIAAVRLHGTLWSRYKDASSRDNKLASAKAILSLAASIGELNLRYLNPIIANIWMEAAQVLMDEISLLRNERRPNWDHSEALLCSIVGQAVRVMEIFASTSKIVDVAVRKIKDCFGLLQFSS